MTNITVDRNLLEQVLKALEAGPDVDPVFAGETEHALKAALEEPIEEPLTDTYVQAVPDKCDRIVWRGHYFHLPVNSTSKPVEEPVQETSAERTLKRMGYTDCGGQFWKPPLGTPAQLQEPVAWSHINSTSDTKWHPRPVEPVEDTDNKAASIRWQLCLLAQTEEFSDDVRNQIGRGVWLIDRLSAKLQEPVATVVVRHYIDGTYAGNALNWNSRNGENDFPVGTKLYTAPQPAQPVEESVVKWGVDWGVNGDRSCVSIVKKHPDGVLEVVAVEYGPEGSAPLPPKEHPCDKDPQSCYSVRCQLGRVCKNAGPSDTKTPRKVF